MYENLKEKCESEAKSMRNTFIGMATAIGFAYMYVVSLTEITPHKHFMIGLVLGVLITGALHAQIIYNLNKIDTMLETEKKKQG